MDQNQKDQRNQQSGSRSGQQDPEKSKQNPSTPSPAGTQQGSRSGSQQQGSQQGSSQPGQRQGSTSPQGRTDEDEESTDELQERERKQGSDTGREERTGETPRKGAL